MSDTVPGDLSTTAVVAVGTPVSGVIDDTPDEDWYRVGLQAGTAYIIELRGVASGSGSLRIPSLLLSTGSGTDVAFGFDTGNATEDARLVFVPPASGDYLVKARGSNSAGSFVLSVAADDHRDTAAGATPLTIGATVSGRVDYIFEPVVDSLDGFGGFASDADWFRVDLLAGQSYRFTARGKDSGGGTLTDPYLSLRDATGREMSSDNNSGEGADAQIDFQPTASAAYFLVVSASASNPVTDDGKTYVVSAATMLDTTPPRVVSFNPADGAGAVAVGAQIVVTFSEPVVRGSGSIVLKTAAGSVVEVFEAASSGRLTVSGTTLQVDPSADLTASTTYVLEIPPGAIKDSTGNAYAGISTYDFTTFDPTPPTVVSASPPAGATGVLADTSVTFSFSEPIVKGKGSIVLRGPAGEVIETLDAATSFRVSIVGNTLTIDPAAQLATSTRYRLDLPSGVVKDTAGNDLAGAVSHEFTTAPLAVRSFAPAPGETWVDLGVNLVVDFNAAIQRGTGTVVLRAAGAVVESFDAATSSRLTVAGTKLTIDPTAGFAPGTELQLELSAGVVKDLAGTGLAVPASMGFSTLPVTGHPIVGTPLGDTLVGTALDDYIDGGDGNDFLDGADGNDTLQSGGGTRVTFQESRGDDVMIVRSGTSSYTLRIFGPNDGNDTLVAPMTYTLENLVVGSVGQDGFVEMTFGKDFGSDALLPLTEWIENVVFVGDLRANALGNDSDNRMTGNLGANKLLGEAGDDWFEGGGGDDRIDGGAGIDMARFAGAVASYRVSQDAAALVVTDLAGVEGTDTLEHVERLAFADTHVAFDIDGHAGVVAKIIGAVFGRQFLTNKSFVGIGLDLLDGGMGVPELVSLAVQTDVMAQLAGSHSDSDFVRLVFGNVVGRPPEPAELTEFVGLLSSGAHTQSSLAWLACETSFNALNIDLLGLASSGLPYLPPG